jgi:tetratricopeptide (TPR) repeat protein
VFKQDNTYNLQQLHDENKEFISHTYTSHRNEQFREPNAHEKNSLLVGLKNKLDNIDAIIQKAKQDKLAEERKQTTPNQQSNTTQEQKSTQTDSQQSTKSKPKNEDTQTISTNNHIVSQTKTTTQQMLEATAKDGIIKPDTNTATSINTQSQQVQESKTEEPKQQYTEQKDNAAPKDYSNITTFGQAAEAIKAEPENYRHYVTRAKLYIKKQDYKNAQIDYKKAQELTQSKDVAILIGLAKVYILLEQPTAALTIYSQALELSPSNTEILNNRAHCYEALGQEENFFKDIEKAIEINPTDARIYISRAEHYMAKNNFQESLKDVNKIIELRPENASARYFRGILNYNLQNYQDCFDDMKKTLELKTDENEVYKYLGICSYKSNNLSDATNYLKKAIEFGFDNGDIYYYRANTEFQSGAFDAALQDADKAIEKDQKKYEYYLIRAKIYNEKNIFDKAEKDYNKALKLNASFDSFIERADFFAKHDKNKEALKDYTAAITLNNQNAQAYRKRGYVYQKLKKDYEAESDFEQAFKLDPSSSVPIENKNIPQVKEPSVKVKETLKQATQQSQPAEVVEQMIEESPAPSVIEPANNQGITQASQQQEPQQPQEPTNQPVPLDPAAKPIPDYKAQASATTAPKPTKIITPDNEQEKKPKKSGFFSKLFKKDKKENTEIHNEIVNEVATSVPSLHPSDIETAYNRANINYKNKKYDMALEDLSKILSKEHGYAKGYLLRANVYADSGDNNKALEDLNKTIELSPSFIAYFKRAEIYSLQNNDDAALADLGKTIELNQKFGGGYVGMAKIYVKRGDKEKAIENYNLAKKYDIKYAKISDAQIKSLSTAPF